MEKQKKKKVSVLMYPEMEQMLDATYSLHGFSSRSEFVCKAVDFYNGFLTTENSEEYMNKTMLSFLQDKLERLEARICKQLFRMCVEMSVAAHVSAHTSPEVDDSDMAELRKRCIKAVRSTVGTIRHDNIYAIQNGRMFTEEELDEAEY